MPFTFAAIKTLIANLRRNPEQVRKEKLDQLFQVNNRLRSNHNGRVYTVHEVNLGSALLTDHTGQVLMVNWLTPLGNVKTKVADNWDIVPLESKQPSGQHAHPALIS